MSIYGQTKQRLTFSSRVKQVSAGLNFFLILTERGEVYSAGRNN